MPQTFAGYLNNDAGRTTAVNILVVGNATHLSKGGEIVNWGKGGRWKKSLLIYYREKNPVEDIS